MISVPELIAKKRDRGELTATEIRTLIERYTKGEVPDYQMSAFAMAVFFNGMSFEETVALTLAMRDSGEVISFDDLALPKIDKHSTGGVGDKVSICLAPIVAACGIAVPMMSGRGLGHTGGTLDKLEAIPGFNVNLSVAKFRRQTQKLHCALIGQTTTLAPADKRFYALRDVTGTVESIPLITASILSKKLAEGIDGLVLDVKVGRGAFMKTEEDARNLAKSLVRVGRLAKKEVVAVLTAMHQPLGNTIGNAIETAEAFEILHDRGPDDVRECTEALGEQMLLMGGVAKTRAIAKRMIESAIRSGDAIRKMEAIIKAQGGDPRVVAEPDRLPKAKNKKLIVAKADGYIAALDPLALGQASLLLGAGRTRSDDVIDPSAGIVLHKKIGDRVRRQDPLATLLSAKSVSSDSLDRVRAAITLSKKAPTVPPLVVEILRK
ncbi:MAG: thymidine phosphorylase [Polyangiales bacterium]